MTIDILNPKISKVASGLEGKVILIYGSNNLGKTFQSTRLPKPYYLAIEDGLRAIPGIPFAPINNWRDIKTVIKQFTNPKTLNQVKEMYQTIIFDGVYDSAIMCQQYITSKYGAVHMGEVAQKGENRPNLWTAYETEYLTEITKLLKSGFTVVFIGHADKDENGKFYPRGDKRSMVLIRNKADITAYIQGQGVDENNNVINSKAWFVETDEFFARSRFTHIVSNIEFTAENLEKAITDAIKKEEEVSGHKAITFEEQEEMYKTDELVYEDLMEDIKQVGQELANLDKLDDLTIIVESHLGVGAKVTECKKGQEQVMSVILNEMKELLEESN